MTTGHYSVLLQETIEALSLSPGNIVIDATAGGGGHTKAAAQAVAPNGIVLAIDRDEENLVRAKKAVSDTGVDVRFELGNFRDTEHLAKKAGIDHVDAALFDLGWSSFHLSSGRGFSFKENEPLLMTYEAKPREDAVTAREIVNSWQEEHIADIIYGFGEERFSRRIARAIVEARNEKPIETTFDLVAVIESAVPHWYVRGRIHPATRTFQALRIAVNEELESLERGLGAACELLVPGGRVAVISFHSIEDRIVKNYFKDKEKQGFGETLSKKPIVPSSAEIAENPRSRSAKLRVFKKL